MEKSECIALDRYLMMTLTLPRAGISIIDYRLRLCISFYTNITSASDARKWVTKSWIKTISSAPAQTKLQRIEINMTK